MTKPTIGWIGLGTMGNPMAKSLRRSGYQLTVYNRDAGKTRDLQEQGATVADSPAELIAKVDLVIIMVTDDQAISAIFNDGEGLLSANVSGKIIINMTNAV